MGQDQKDSLKNSFLKKSVKIKLKKLFYKLNEISTPKNLKYMVMITYKSNLTIKIRIKIQKKGK